MKTLLPAFVLLMLCFEMRAQSWELKKEVDGIKIFTAKRPDAKFKSVRVECMVNARLPSLVALLLDVERNHEWVYHIKSSKLLKRISEKELIYQAEVCTPWPFTNRDLVVHLKCSRDQGGMIHIDSEAEPGFIPVNKDLVRITSSRSHWVIASLSPGQQKLVYEISFDPGGSVPAWLTNMFLTEGPSETFTNLRSRVLQEAYKDAHFGFLDQPQG
jgi:hypothetical protein